MSRSTTTSVHSSHHGSSNFDAHTRATTTADVERNSSSSHHTVAPAGAAADAAERHSSSSQHTVAAAGAEPKASPTDPEAQTPASKPAHASAPSPTAVSDEKYDIVDWDPEDPEAPLHWSPFRKFGVIFVVCMASTCVTCTSSMITAAYTGIQERFGVGQEVAILGLSLYVAGLGIGPMLLAPLSEFYGRRPVYVISFGAFFLLGLPVALANNIAVFMIFRFLTGFAGSAFLSIAGGSVADLYLPKDAVVPMAFYTLSPFAGPVFGPIISGFINQNTSWRWTFWVLLIWSGVLWAGIVLFLPETFAPILLTKRARRLRKATGNSRLRSRHELVLASKSIPATVRVSAMRVVQLLTLEPMLLLLCIWSALLLGILYLLFESFPLVFQGVHGFDLQQTGLSFLGIFIGMVIASMTMPWWAKRFRKIIEEKGSAPPESRLPMAMVGAFLTPASLFWFGLTTFHGVPWIVPCIAIAPFGAGVLLIYTAVFSYTTDAYRPVAASGMAANSAMRSSFAAAFPLFANPMYHRLGLVGATCLLAGLNVLMIPLPFVFYKYGARIRARSRFTSV